MRLWVAKQAYRTIQGIRGEPVFEKLSFLENSQWLDEEKIKNAQLDKLKQILIHAFESIPYYNKKLGPFSDLLYNLDSVSKLSELPMITKREIQENYESLQWPNYKGKRAIESTSGSAGDPFRFALDRNASAFIRALSYREHLWYGLDMGAKEARFYGIPMDFLSNLKERTKDFLMNRKRFIVFDLSEKKLLEYYKRINKYKPDYIYGYTSAVFEFVKFLKSKKLKLKKDFLKAVIVTSEVLYEYDRHLMESYLNVPVVNEYGTSELGIIAAQCPEGGMHISCENVIVEIIKNGRPAQCGERGEIVLTGLNNYLMPLIRYEVGDVGRLSLNSCSCGRGLPLLDQIDGRVNNMVLTPEGKISSGLVFYYISRSLIEKSGGIKKFKVVQEQLDRITFHIVRGEDFEDKSLRVLEDKTHEYLSPNISVDFEFCNDIPHTTGGKIIHFISRVDSPFEYSKE